MNQLLLFTSLHRFARMNTVALLVSLFTVNSVTATDLTTKIDSLQQVLRMTTEDTARVDLYLQIGKAYGKIQVDSAFFFLQKALVLSQNVSYYRGVVLSQNSLALFEGRYGSSDQSIEYLRQSLALARQTRDSALLRSTYQYTGVIHTYKSNFRLALENYQQALTIAKALQDTLSIATTLADMAVVHFESKSYDYAIKLFKQALPLFLRLNRSGLPTIYLNLGNAYLMKKDYLSAQKYFSIALREAQTVGDERVKAIVLNNIAFLYKLKQEYKKALSHAKQAQTIYQAIQPGKHNYALEETLGSIYVALRQYQRARVHYNNSIEALEELNNFECYIEIYTSLIRLDSLEGKFDQGFIHQQNLMSVKDSLLTNEKNKAVEELKIQYETEQKDQEITLLQAQTDRQQLEARQQSLVRNSFVTGSVALLLLLGLGYNRYRFKQRALGVMQQQNEEIQAQKERVERKHRENQLLLKEVHHRVKNNLQIVLSILNTQADSLRDPVTTAAIRESQHRVHSMALIHQSLYQSDDLSQIQAQQYLHEMVETVYQSYRSEARPVRLRLQIEDVPLDMSTAVPVGLIVTELVTNACKYGLATEASELSVSLRAETATQYRLTVADNGPGLPPDFDLAQSDSLGLQLVQGLAQQLDGELVVQNQSGACFELLFQRAA